MRLKSKYRRQAFTDGGRIDELPIPIEPPVEAAAPVENQPEPPPVPESAPAPDDATAALRRQIEALNHARTVDQQAAIAQQGANERRQVWLAQTPGAKDHIAALGYIHRAALDAGFVDTSPEYFRFMESQLAALKQPAEEMQQKLAMQPTPKFFAPLPARSAPNPSRIVSAPVSREVPNGSGKRHTPGKITLTPTEVEHARVSGLTPEEYARQLLKYREALADGSYRDNRER